VKRSALVLGAGLLVVAACSSGGSSSGDTTTAATAGSSTSGGAVTSTGTATTATPTTEGATTTAAKNLPPCHVDALASATAPVTITFWFASGGEIGPVLQKVTDTYNASQTKVKVNLVDQQGTDDILAKYRSSSTGDRPNLAQMSDTNLQLLADSKTIVPVQSCIDEEKFDLSDYADRAISYYTIQGALQGMPFNLSMPVLYYNKAAFRAAGLDPEKPPATVDELRDVSQKIVTSGAATFGIALDTGASSGGSWYIEQYRAKADLLYADNDNGRQARATKVLFNDDVGVQQVTAVQKLVTDRLAVSVGQNTDSTQDLLKLADPDQPAAMTNHTSAALSSVINVLKAGTIQGFAAEDLGIGPMPAPTGNGGLLVGGAALWIVKDKSDAETAATWDYVKYLTSAAAQAEWAAGTGYVPIRKSSLEQAPIKDLYTSDPRFAVAYQQLNSGAVTPATAGPVLGPQNEVRQATSEAMQAIFDGADVKTALDTAAQKADAQIADYANRTGTS
jgi:sn-glycerol 3-phosphate transport system substrate-binding protein